MEKNIKWLKIRKKFAVLLLIATMVIMAGCKKKMNFQDYLDLGEKYLTETNYEEAIVAFTKAIELDPKNPEGYKGLANVYVAAERYEDALDTLEQGLEEIEDDSLNDIYEDIQKRYDAWQVLYGMESMMDHGVEYDNWFDLWNYMLTMDFQMTFDQLSEKVTYTTEDGENKLVLYPCGHIYYGSAGSTDREGHGIWTSCSLEESWIDFYDGSWENDFPNGQGTYRMWQIQSINSDTEDTFHYEGDFKDGCFTTEEPDAPYQGVLHAMEIDTEKSMQEREFSQELFDYWQGVIAEPDAYLSGFAITGSSEQGMSEEEKEELGVLTLLSADSFYSMPETYYPDQNTYLLIYGGGKGFGTPYEIVDTQGNALLQGYEECLWKTSDGYVKLLACDPGQMEDSAENYYSILMGELEGDFYAVKYDWSGNETERHKLEGDASQAFSQAYAMYPQDYGQPLGIYSLGPDTYDQYTPFYNCQVSEDGYVLTDDSGQQVSRIRIQDPDLYVPVQKGNIFGLWNPEYYEFARIYYVNQ